jgi:hypothetical protein
VKLASGDIDRLPTASRYRPYQLECPTCRDVAALHLRADILRPHINNLLQVPMSLYNAAVELTLRQRVADDWSSAIANCLRLGMATHARCGACAILMGPGHQEPGNKGYCGTHSDSPESSAELSDDKTDVLTWVADHGGRRGESRSKDVA